MIEGRARIRSSVLAALLTASLAACGGGRQGPQPMLREDAYPGTLVDSGLLPSDLFLRQRIDARYGKSSLSFSAVLQSETSVLSLLALAPYGPRAFLIEQRGQAVRFVKYMGRGLPFPPRFILLDVHRALFLRAMPESAKQAPDDRVFVVERDGERIREEWRGGMLLERSFERLDGNPKGVIRIRYGTGLPFDFPARPIPADIELDNGWFGYTLSIHTFAD